MKLSSFILFLYSTAISPNFLESTSFPDTVFIYIGISPSPEHTNSVINCLSLDDGHANNRRLVLSL